MNLREYLSRYNYYSCPDDFFLAWKMLFFGDKKDKEVLRQAEKDMIQKLNERPQGLFNANRRKMVSLGKRKYNWY